MIVLIFLWFLTVSAQDFNNTEKLDEPELVELLSAQTNLSKTLFEDYDPGLSPIPEDSNGLTNQSWWYFFTLTRFKLIDVDEPKEQFTVVTELVQEWHDWRLRWDPEEYANVTALHLRIDKLWTPPVIAYGASEIVEHRDQNTRMVKVFNNGTVRAFIPMKITTNCKLNMTNFPFDLQECEIRLGLPVFSASLYTLDVFVSDVLMSDSQYSTMSNSVWEIFDIETGSQHIKSDDVLYDAKMGIVKLGIKRNSKFYLYMIVLPTFIINSISIAGVFMKNTDKIDRLTIGLTHIMTMTFILALIVDKLPRTEVIPLLGKYIIFGLSTMIVALVISTYLKKVSCYVSGKLAGSENAFLRKLRTFFGSPLRFTILIALQAINILAAFYLWVLYVIFEDQFGEAVEEFHDDGGFQDVELNQFLEIGVTSDDYEVIGSLPSFRARFGVLIHPTIAVIKRPLKITMNPDEVASVFWIPISRFLSDQNHSTLQMDAIYYVHLFQNFNNSEKLKNPEAVELLTAQTKLWDKLFNNNYENGLAPIPEDSNQIMNQSFWYQLTVTRLKLIDVDEPREQFTVVVQLVQEWHDWRLEWNKEEYSNLTALHVRLDTVWSPPIIAYGASEVVEHREQNTRMAKVFNNGTVRAFVPMKITSSCKLNLTMFPFDLQTCEIRLGLPVFSSTLFDFDILISEVLVSDEMYFSMSNSVWEIINIQTAPQHIISNDILFDAEMGIVQLGLKRNSNFYFFVIVMPTFFINAISIVGVFMKKTKKFDRLTIGLTHIMTMTFVLALIVDKLPRTADPTLLGGYMFFALINMIFALIVSSYLKIICTFVSKKLEGCKNIIIRSIRWYFGEPLRFTVLCSFQILNFLAVWFLTKENELYEKGLSKLPDIWSQNYTDVEFPDFPTTYGVTALMCTIVAIGVVNKMPCFEILANLSQSEMQRMEPIQVLEHVYSFAGRKFEAKSKL